MREFAFITRVVGGRYYGVLCAGPGSLMIVDLTKDQLIDFVWSWEELFGPRIKGGSTSGRSGAEGASAGGDGL